MTGHVDPKQPMALVSIPYGDVLLNADDAYQLFRLMCKARIVQYEWNDKQYKFKDTGSDGNSTMKSFSLEEYAKLALNSTD